MKFGKFIFTQQSTVIIGKTLNLLTVNQANLHISLAILNAQKKGRPNFGNGWTGAIL